MTCVLARQSAWSAVRWRDRLFHKHLGLTDADKDRLVQYLQNGGAAVVVMADRGTRYEPAKAELARLHGQVANYEVPEETVEQVEEDDRGRASRRRGRRPCRRKGVVVAEEDIPASAVLKGHVQTVQGIGPPRVAALATIGITTRQELLEFGATPEGRAEIAAQSQISEKLVAGWVSAVDLTRVTGIGPQSAELLEAAGVATVADLAQQDAASLHEKLVAVNASRNLVPARGSRRVADRESDRNGQGASSGGYLLTTLASNSLPDAFRAVTCWREEGVRQ